MILVTGATGNIGREVVRLLSASGQKVRALTRSAAKGQALAGAGVEIAEGQLAQPDTLDAAMKGVDHVFLCSSGDPAQVELQGNVIRAAKKAGVQHVVKLSALGAAKDSTVAISRWHAYTERQLADSGIGYTILQPHMFMQNLLMNAGLVKERGTFYGAAKNGKMGMVDVRDIAKVAATTLTEAGHEGKTYVITGPQALTFADVAAAIGKAIGKPVTYTDAPPPGLFEGLVKGAGLPEWLAGDLVAMQVNFSQGKGDVVTDVVEKVGKTTPRTLAQFVEENKAAFGG